MKPEFNFINAKTSMWIAAPILAGTSMTIISNSINLPAKDVYPIVISAFGITAALSGVCFTMATSSNTEHTIRYSGEKFLHSSLLLIQFLAIIFAKDTVLGFSFVHINEILKSILTIIFNLLLVIIGVTAASSWFFGFDELNTELWGNWKGRIEIIRESHEKKQAAKKQKVIKVAPKVTIGKNDKT
jgi:hypothetical protein